jgi:hypothetical protein
MTNVWEREPRDDDSFWWAGHKCPLEEVVKRAEAMTIVELDEVIAEMTGRIAVIGARFQDTRRQRDERKGAQFALARLTEKRTRVKLIRHRKHEIANVETKEMFRNRVEDMLEMVDRKANEEPAEALRLIAQVLRMMNGLDDQ